METGKNIVLVGGGAAGFFAAINLAEQRPDYKITLVERSKKVLEKVRISGGGRCNVCHAEFDPRELVKAYPRGGKALRGPFTRFCSGDTVGWYADRGVDLKIEDDGRMFPVSNSSSTILECLQDSAERAGVRVLLSHAVERIEQHNGWLVHLKAGSSLRADAVVMAPGSSPQMWKMLQRLGHTIVPAVPSLFTFNIKDSRLADLPGLSVPLAQIKVLGTSLKEEGPLLITHWGLSGPAILKTSAWGARILNEKGYQFEIQVAWVPGKNPEAIADELRSVAKSQVRKTILSNSQFGLPNRLWKRLGETAGIRPDQRWADLNKAQTRALATELTAGRYQVNGKSTFKEEFVTAGGVSLKEINFKTMESKLFPGLYFAGEFMDIDAITGGYNFQAAWTTSWIAAQSIAGD